jgi:hypothetical protein
MFKALGHWFKQRLGLSKRDKPGIATGALNESTSQMTAPVDSIDLPSQLVPYDENLLERARTQWQFGDWHSLASLDRDNLQHHPDRAKIVLLAAAGRLQIGQDAEARQYIRLAQDWGCGRQLISQILISGVHNSIGMAAAVGAQEQRAALHFESAIRVGAPGSDVKLLTQARGVHQLNHSNPPGVPILGNLSVFSAAEKQWNLAQEENKKDKFNEQTLNKAWIQGRWEFLAKLDNADLLHYSNRMLMALLATSGHQQIEDSEGVKRCSRLAQSWGATPQMLQSYLAAGIRNTMGISEVIRGDLKLAAKHFSATLTVGDGIQPDATDIEERVVFQIKKIKNIHPENVITEIKTYLSHSYQRQK